MVFITARIAFIFVSSTLVHIYMIFIYLQSFVHHLEGSFKTNITELVSQFVERCTGITEVMGSNPVQACIFFTSYFYYWLSSVHNCEDH